MRRTFRWTLLALVLAAVTGCALFPGNRSESRSGVSSSLVRYLYPDDSVPPVSNEQPVTIRLPARIGLAFVPARAEGLSNTVLPEALKEQAIERVRKAFSDRPYVQRIEIVPETYMRYGGNAFATLDQLSRLYGFDLIALVSYDQVSVQSDTRSALWYLTVAGAYVIKGDRLETNTFVDTAVLDIKTRRLLFRAAGTHVDTQRATLVEAAHERKRAQQDSFAAAMQQMTVNLDQELERFRQRASNDSTLRITTTAAPAGSGKGNNYGGGGASFPLIAAGLLLGAAWLRRYAGAKLKGG